MELRDIYTLTALDQMPVKRRQGPSALWMFLGGVFSRGVVRN